MEKYYILGGVVLALRGSQLNENDRNWNQFSCDEKPAELTCHISYVEELEIPADFERRGDILLADGGRLHLSSGDGAPYARVKEYGKEISVEIPESYAPWGQNAAELFEVLALPHLLLGHKRLLLHGAYINYCGNGLLFTGPSGIGKTTQAQLWQRIFGSRSVNEDRAVVSAVGNEFKIHGVPVAGSSPVCDNISLSLRAIIVLGQGSENTLERMRPAQAAARLMDGTYQLPAFREDIPAACELALEIAANVPVYQLICRPEPQAAELLHKTLFV